MAANPRIVTADRQIFWDGVQQRLPKGQQIDVPPGSALEAAIGVQFLIPLPGTEAAQEALAVAQGGGGAVDSTALGGGGGGSTFAVTPASPPKSRAVGKAGSDSKDGGQ